MFNELLEVEFALAMVAVVIVIGFFALLVKIYRKRNKRTPSEDEDTHWI